MKKAVVAVYDKKIGAFDQTLMVSHVGLAIREFDVVRKDTNTKIGKHPSDFDLYKIAEFDETSGNYENLQPHLQLATGMDT